MTRTVLRNAFVVTMDAALRNIPRSDVLIEDDRIAVVGPDLAVMDAQAIDCTDCIVMPGLIDTHRHVWQGAIRSVTGDWSLNDYFRGIRMNVANAYTAEDMYAAHYHGGLEAIDAGITTMVDYCHNLNTPDHAHEAIRGLRDSGARVLWAFGFNRPPLDSPYFTSTEERANFARELARHSFPDSMGLVTMAIAPEEAHFWRQDPSRGKAQFALARELGIPVTWHCNSSSDRETGKHLRDVARIAELELLGPDLLLVHLNVTDWDEWKMVADSGAGVSFTPDTELQMGMGWSPTETARQLGIPQSYGADIISNNTGDLISALRLALQTARCRVHIREFGDKLADRPGAHIPASEALAWGTIDAARAIGMDCKIGSITPGKQADIVVIPTDTIPLVGWDRTNPAATVVLQAHARDIQTVFVAGKKVKDQGTLTADSERAVGLLRAANERITNEMRSRGGYLHISPEDSIARARAIRTEA
jgi:5-methylthioadenosine/S-adenosylhomocysteine deaminase